MKAGIITITDNNNYGNRLQNYALEKVLLDFGVDVKTIWDKKYTKKSQKVKKIIKGIFFSNKYPSLKRIKKFEEFSKKYTNIFYHSYDKDLNNMFDLFIVGSDQIFTKSHLDKMTFLIEAETKKGIAFSPSFGKSYLEEEEKIFFKKLLPKLKKISVREEAGKEIITDLYSDFEVKVLIDPTMLLNSDEWTKVMKKPKKMKADKFILNYFLGELSDERKSEIERIARENNCDIINILDKKSPFYNCGPSEFLYLEKNAFLVCTDSFHSSVFSIIFKRPFIIFNREQNNMINMNSRLETLIKKFDLKDRIFDKNITSKNLNIDYSGVDEKLEFERKQVIDYLEDVII